MMIVIFVSDNRHDTADVRRQGQPDLVRGAAHRAWLRRRRQEQCESQ